MHIHRLEHEQRLPRPREEVFAFFADAANLQRLTPPLLRFEILTPAPIPMQVGTIIQYRLTLHGLPVRWLTSIQEWEPGLRFVDVQIRGPYALWHHTHLFADDGRGGTVMRDLVRYAIGFGAIGELVHRALVAGDLQRIFAFRGEEIARLLG